MIIIRLLLRTTTRYVVHLFGMLQCDQSVVKHIINKVYLCQYLHHYQHIQIRLSCTISKLTMIMFTFIAYHMCIKNPFDIFSITSSFRMFSICCAGCKQPIVPKKGQTKAPRIRALDKDYHLSCFKCYDCSLVLSPGVKGRECWPVKHRLLCYQ